MVLRGHGGRGWAVRDGRISWVTGLTRSCGKQWKRGDGELSEGLRLLSEQERAPKEAQRLQQQQQQRGVDIQEDAEGAFALGMEM